MKTHDPLVTLVQDHKLVSEWMTTMWNAIGLLEGVEASDLIRLQEFLREHVMDHFELEERVIFPALLELDTNPAVAQLITALREDHVDILSKTSRLFGSLSWAMTNDDSEESLRALMGRARKLIEDLLAHAAREDAHLLPLVQDHRQAIAERMPA